MYQAQLHILALQFSGRTVLHVFQGTMAIGHENFTPQQLFKFESFRALYNTLNASKNINIARIANAVQGHS